MALDVKAKRPWIRPFVQSRHQFGHSVLLACSASYTDCDPISLGCGCVPKVLVPDQSACDAFCNAPP